MKSLLLLLLLGFTFTFTGNAQESCLTVENIKNLDAQWEQAQLNADADFFQNVLGENFIWVHNHASMFDDKNAVVKRAENQSASGNSDTRSRVSSEVQVLISGKTAIVTGFTIVDRGPTPTKYHFMRTYIEKDGKCLLIANHTMAIPEGE